MLQMLPTHPKPMLQMLLPTHQTQLPMHQTLLQELIMTPTVMVLMTVKKMLLHKTTMMPMAMVLMIDSNKPLVNPPQEMHHRLLEHQKKPMPKVVQQMMEAV